MSKFHTPHIKAEPSDFAKTVLMPGDPLRSKFIAENFLENARLVNNVRGIQGYTGTYKGTPVSVMASGMGMPSIGIYSYELYNFFGVDNIIRVGSAGGISERVKIRDVIIGMGACTTSNYAVQYGLEGTFAPICDYELMKAAIVEAEKIGASYAVGNILSSDIFYNADPSAREKWTGMGVLGVEMEAVRHGNEKNVGIILWAGYSAFMKDIEGVCSHYAKMGVKGFKVDFLDRNDQKMEDFIYKASEVAARYRLVMDFHGCHQPTGLQRRFPNVLNYEGVFGLEQMRKRQLPEYDMVEFDVTIPYIRYVAGFADYTPGAMKNGSYTNFRDVRTEPMSQGTRCRQLAEFVVFDAPLNMICDSPTNYELEPVCSEFLYRVPTVWDETIVLDGKVGDYIITARRKGDTWYVGAMTDWTERDLKVDISRLFDGQVKVEAWQDGKVAHKFGNDYQKKSYIAEKSIDIHLAPGGGWAAIISK